MFVNYVMNQNSRDKRQETAPTVCATIDQFNRVSLAVIATGYKLLIQLVHTALLTGERL